MLRSLVFGTVCLLALFVHDTNGRIEPLPYLPENLQYHFDVYKQMTRLDLQPGKPIFWSSLQQYISRFVDYRHNMTQEEAEFFRQQVQTYSAPIYENQANNPRVKRQARGIRVRREIRDLTIPQRRRYFRAVNRLKTDTRLSPNIYDVLADFHTGGSIARAHFGPAFPAWHRLYLWLYESFLRQYEPSVTVPYWASVLDNEMTDSTESVMWSEGFFGNGVGEINSGPFRNWRTLNPARVFRRNVGSGPLISYEEVERILNKTLNRQILVPTADPDSNLEIIHGGPHMHMGGSMSLLNEAVRDPVFYSHHAFIDYIWEEFRLNQRERGINPQTDYPFDANDPRFRASHAPTEMMGFFPNNELNIDYQNRVGYLNVFFNLVRYEPVPTCPSCGGSPYLFCNRNLATPRCVSRTRRGMGGQNYIDDLFGNTTSGDTFGNTTSGTTPDPSMSSCPRKPFVNEIDATRIPVDSSYNWVYVPVKIISKRPPTYHNFKQYSLYTYTGGFPRPQVPVSKAPFLQMGTQKGYEKCDQDEESVGKIKIVTYGLNYYGKTEEYAFVDNRLGVSQSTGYAVVKAPSTGSPSDVMVGAFDSCGRVCRPYCLQGTNPTSTSKFTGGMRVTSAFPLQYGQSYGDAILESWDITSGNENPEYNSANVPLTFYCDSTDDWVWDVAGRVPLESYTPSATTSVTSPTTTSYIGIPPANNPINQWHRGTQSIDSPINQRNRKTQSTNRRKGMYPGNVPYPPSPPQSVGKNHYQGRLMPSKGCYLSPVCRLTVPCSPCGRWTTQQCIGSALEAICIDGRYAVRDNYRRHGRRRASG